MIVGLRRFLDDNRILNTKIKMQAFSTWINSGRLIIQVNLDMNTDYVIRITTKRGRTWSYLKESSWTQTAPTGRVRVLSAEQLLSRLLQATSRASASWWNRGSVGLMNIDECVQKLTEVIRARYEAYRRTGPNIECSNRNTQNESNDEYVPLRM
jgi:hypothetical protein